VPDFQDWPPWRSLVVASAAELARYTGQHLITPQAVLNGDYLAGIFTGLRAAGLAVFHILLDASDEVLRHRIEASREARQWRLDHLAEYRQARRREPDAGVPGTGRSCIVMHAGSRIVVMPKPRIAGSPHHNGPSWTRTGALAGAAPGAKRRRS